MCVLSQGSSTGRECRSRGERKEMDQGAAVCLGVEPCSGGRRTLEEEVSLGTARMGVWEEDGWNEAGVADC